MLIPMVVAVASTACTRHPPAPTAAAASTAAAAAAAGCLPTHDGYLRARLRGEKNLDIDWRDDQLQCEGGPRPDQHGIRLAFAGPMLAGGHRVRFVIGIAGAEAADAGHALPANVTIIFEGEGKLYSTRGEDKCTIDQLTRVAVAGAPVAHTMRVAGRGFCVGPAAALDGSGGLLLSRFDFAGAMVDAE